MEKLTQTQKQYAIKKLLVIIKGGKCSVCGYNKNITSLSFHHTDPKTKDPEISFHGLYSQESFEKILIELEKCVLLCHNCHNELHHPNGEWNNVLDIDESFIKPRHKKTKCLDCGEEVKNSYISKRCQDCNYRNREKTDWPEFIDLLNEVDKTSLTAVAKRLGVSRTAVSARIKRRIENADKPIKKCKICDRPPTSKGFCRKHYEQNRRAEKRLEKYGSRDYIDTGGENNSKAKLTWNIIEELRNKYNTNNYTIITLSKEYNINSSTVSNIIHNRTWIK